MSHTSRRLVAGGVLAAALLAACPGSWGRPDKAQRSALWVGPGAPELSVVDLQRLDRAGIGEVFAEAAELKWSGSAPQIVSLPLPALPRRTAATLAVRGRWPTGELDTKAVAAELGRAVRRLEQESEEKGIVALGVHFDVDATGALASYGAVLAALRGGFDRTHFLSASFDRRWLADPAAQAVADGVDFLVAFLYGQRPGAPDDAAAWDLQAVEANFEPLEKLGRKYLLGVVTVGAATQLDASGAPVSYTTGLSLAPLVRDPLLELEHGFTLKAIDRQVYTFKAHGAVHLGDWRLRPGAGVRVVRLSSNHLEEFRRLVGAHDLPHHLGELFYRLPRADERLSLSLANLLAALGKEPATPRLDVQVTLARRTPRSLVLHVKLLNDSDETTEVAQLDSNFVEIDASGATVGRVDPGQFYRFEMLAKRPDGELVRSFRDAGTLRLYEPVLEAHEAVESGDAELLLRGRDADLTVYATFLLPDGRDVEFGPVPWTPEAK